MISKDFYRLKKICCEDISLIENYNEAVNDTTQVWDCHHRKEIELNKNRQELIDIGLYYNRPANELVFITHSDHTRLHQTNKKVNQSTKDLISEAAKKRVGDKNPFYGKRHTEESRQKIKDNHPDFKGEKHPMYGKHHTEEAKQKMKKPKSEEHKQKLRKPKRKYKWLTPTGEIRIMGMANAHKHHPDWILIGEV